MSPRDERIFPRHSWLPRILEWPLVVVARLLYRIRVEGQDHFPSHGGVLVLANHISFVDVLVLQLAIPRQMRFVADRSLCSHWFFRAVFRWSRSIIVNTASPLDCMRAVQSALADGEVICVFPEGAISRTGQLMPLRRGFEVMARRSNCLVVPVAHDGLWGSLFSFSKHRYLFKSPRLLRTPVAVVIGRPVLAEATTRDSIRLALLDLGASAFSRRPVLQRNLARELVRTLAKRPFFAQVVDRTTDRRELTSLKLLAAAATLGRRLRHDCAERRVGIVLPPGAGAFIANLAVVISGKTPVNLNFTSGRQALEECIRSAEIQTVISAAPMRTRLPDFPWPARTLDLKQEILSRDRVQRWMWAAAAVLLPNQVLPSLLRIPKEGGDKEAAMLFTSGSSGTPKGVVLSHRNILANCWQISCLSIIPHGGTLLACLPVFHSFGFTVDLWYPILNGCRTVTVPSPLDTRRIIDAVAEEKATVLVSAPTFLRPFLKRARSAELRSLELVVSGAEHLPDDLVTGFREMFHLDVIQGYGMTEATPVISVNQPNPPTNEMTQERQEGRRPGSVGRLLPGITARILDVDTGAAIPSTERGLLLLSGPNIFRGYHGDLERTSQVFRAGWFVTGDLARFDDEGFLFVEGRLSRFSKIGGEMVPHETIEQVLRRLMPEMDEDVVQLVVTAVPDATKGESLVVLTSNPLPMDAIRQHLMAQGFASLWIPRQVLTVPSIPMLGSGKVDLRGCAQLAAARVKS